MTDDEREEDWRAMHIAYDEQVQAREEASTAERARGRALAFQWRDGESVCARYVTTPRRLQVIGGEKLVAA